MRLTLLDTTIDTFSLAETLDKIDEAISQRRRLHHVSMNVAKLVKMRSDPELRRDVEQADLVGVDGMGIVLGARLLGLPVRERVAGIDLMFAVLDLCARKGYRPYMFGAKPEVLREAIGKARQRWPDLQIAGSRDGYYSTEEEEDVVAGIRASKADCLFIAMSTPRKERFIARHGESVGIPFIMGVGGSFDILAGATRRAPLLWQKLGMEWLYRIYQEPSRMWWRYASTNAAFALLLARALIGQRLGLPRKTVA